MPARIGEEKQHLFNFAVFKRTLVPICALYVLWEHREEEPGISGVQIKKGVESVLNGALPDPDGLLTVHYSQLYPMLERFREMEFAKHDADALYLITAKGEAMLGEWLRQLNLVNGLSEQVFGSYQKKGAKR